MRLLHILTVCALCIAPRAASANHRPPTFDTQQFIDAWAKLAVEQMTLYGVPASVTLAQAIVESGWGKGRVALLGNNYFCIKANNGWTGPVIAAVDDDSLDNKPIDSQFRKYGSIEESFTDHSKFLRENARYRGLFQLSPTDYRGWCYGLKAAGYASKRDYAEHLVSTIEIYGLYLYDHAVPEEHIKALGLPFGDFEEEAEVVLSPTMEPQAVQYPVGANAIAANAPAAQPMRAPSYRLQSGQVPTAAAPPMVEVQDLNTVVKIPLILPKAKPRFYLR